MIIFKYYKGFYFRLFSVLWEGVVTSFLTVMSFEGLSVLKEGF